MMRNKILLEKVKSVLLIFLLVTIISCADKYERNIEKHFKNFILTEENEMDDYEIEAIQRKNGDTLTRTGREIKTIKNKSFLLQNRIANIEAAKNELEYEIDNLIKWNHYIVSGESVYAEEYPKKYLYGGWVLINNITDHYNLGKEGLILERRNKIKKLDSASNDLLTQINDHQRIIESLKNKPDKTILELSSLVKVKGMEASGTKKLHYRVVQSEDGEIKTVKQVR